MTRSGISLVIFDCDGVLVDSEAISNRVLAEEITMAGLPVTCQEATAAFSGHRIVDTMAVIETRLGRTLPAHWLERFEERRADAFGREFKEIAGARSAVQTIIRAGFSICLASQARIEKSLMTLKLVGLSEEFQGKIFSASMVDRGKPYPDLFLYAAEKMGHNPECCAVVEDTALGIEAAKAAGMRPFGYAAGHEAADSLRLAGAEVFGEMRRLPGLLLAPREHP